MRHFLFTIFFLFNGIRIFAQIDSTHTAKHSFYLDVLGAGGYGAVNYEQLLFKKKDLMLSARIGIGTYRINDFQNKFNPDILIPLTAKMLYGKNHKMVMGMGQTFTSIVYNTESRLKPRRAANFHTHFSFGYRYQPVKGGILLGAAYTPILEFNRFLRHWACISVGYTF